MRNVTLGLSDTSSNNSLARNANNASNFSETPPLPARNQLTRFIKLFNLHNSNS